MTFVYLICFLLVTVGAIILLRLNPEKITDDLMRFVSPKQTLREKVLTAKGKRDPESSLLNSTAFGMLWNRQEKAVSFLLLVRHPSSS